eukprot:scaffold7995_cov75-Phaeocystis_antarctica.AAC.1
MQYGLRVRIPAPRTAVETPAYRSWRRSRRTSTATAHTRADGEGSGCSKALAQPCTAHSGRNASVTKLVKLQA